LAAQPLTATEGQGLTGALVATFTDPGTDGTSADYTAGVTWTDSSGNTHTVTGTVQLITGQEFGVFADTGFRYSQEGSFNFNVSVNDVGGTTATATGGVTVAEAAFTNIVAGTPVRTEGQAGTGAVVATFTDPGSTSSSVATYSATVVFTDTSG